MNTSQTESYFDGKIILSKNEVYIPPNNQVLKRVFFISKGKVTLIRFSENGEEFVQNILTQGDFFNMRSILNLVDSRSYLLSGSKGAEISFISCDNLKVLQEKDLQFKVKMQKAIETNILNLEKRIEILTCKKPSDRVIMFLNFLMNKFGSKKFYHDYSQEDIAKLTRLPRPQVSKILSELRHRELISYDRKYIQILSNNLLKQAQ